MTGCNTKPLSGGDLKVAGETAKAILNVYESGKYGWKTGGLYASEGLPAYSTAPGRPCVCLLGALNVVLGKRPGDLTVYHEDDHPFVRAFLDGAAGIYDINDRAFVWSTESSADGYRRVAALLRYIMRKAGVPE